MTVFDTASVERQGLEPSLATVGDYLTLLKPRVMSLVLFTSVAGLIAAPGHIGIPTALTALLCIAVGAGAAAALNMAYDADIDACMARTAARPVACGRIAPGAAYAFGTTLAVFAVMVMGLLVNSFAGALLAFTVFFYFAVYTVWLKRRTPQNIVIGGLAGALPPAIGWAAVSGTLSLAPIILVAIIFLWTPPHFWALALYRSEDYARAGVPMLPVVVGKRETRRQIALYTGILALAALMPVAAGFAGPLYLGVALGLGAWFGSASLAVLRERDEAREPAARRLFAISILYLFALFGALIVERLAGISAFGAAAT